jgi:exopolysaccharide production protein ExoQ
LGSIVFALALPSYGIFAGYGGGAWQGICLHKNTLGYSMAYLLTPIFFLADIPRWQKVVYSLLALFVIAMSQSKGAWLSICPTLAFVGLLFLSRRLRSQEKILLWIATALVGLILVALTVTHFDALAGVLGKDPSMSGRTDIFRLVSQAVLKRPALGYGYGGFWNTAPEAERVGLTIGWTGIGYAENGVLELATQLGLVGVALVVLMVAQALWRACCFPSSHRPRPSVEWFSTVLLLAIFQNLDAGWLIASGDFSWVLILIACIGIHQATEANRMLQDVEASLAVRLINVPIIGPAVRPLDY